MTDATLGAAAPRLDNIRDSYMAQVHRRRLYGGLTLLIFVVLMVSGFNIADDRNAGGFWAGLHQVGDYPADVLSEAWGKRADLPGLIAKYFPALVETVNIAAVSTLIGAIGGLVLSLLATRGLAKWPRLIPVFRRLTDLMRAVPEIVIALVLIFVLGGGPVPAMIAIAIHTAGALGKMFSEVAENADVKPVEGLASTGATWSQTMLLGIVPQVAPNYVSYALLRFEINIRASAILGFVGAGGLGYELRNSMAWGPGRFDEAAAIFILLFGTIVFFDQVSSRYRNRLTVGYSQ
ncbi:Phosphate-import permease protein PhnE [Rhodobacteraceae bacterium THAF1]|uniref:phosphonate ABC transporter, permease protein PhnE n=1 Tax=Palleronia sp. THAF1 TaxID=2587842 RepID=UPI000F3D990A|nr:phosphonate ABC transporter, permease protein PhnE [Palleronia sp. THAF1]QFU09566.1 Phosphate-import permease protein PhnE [Palleronia sp. THAF1]VDC20069.1 Phosphate-import permease protein PhnE [Rhodobacteraceae bacterium THAF1]